MCSLHLFIIIRFKSPFWIVPTLVFSLQDLQKEVSQEGGGGVPFRIFKIEVCPTVFYKSAKLNKNKWCNPILSIIYSIELKINFPCV